MNKLFRTLSIFLGVVVTIGLIGIVTWSISHKTNGQITSAGEERTYLLYVPKTYDPAKPIPLVINIHGFAQWPANQMKVSRWNELADQYGFIVVYPSGTGFPMRWRLSEDPTDPGGPDKEITFFTDLIDKLEDGYAIDHTRVYANGLSNGGGMALLLACRLSDRITAVGGVAGAYLFDWEDCQPNRPVPAIFFHGQADKIVPYEGGPSERFDLPFPKIPEFVESYAAKNDCNLNPITLLDNGNIEGIRYTDCREDADVIFYTITDGGHTWPGGTPLPERITGKTSLEIDATRLMWEFFNEFSLEN